MIMILYVINYLKKNKFQLLFLIVCCFLSALIEIAMPYVTAKFVDDVLVSHSSETFYCFASAIFFISIIAVSTHYFSIIISAKLQIVTINNATYDVLQHIHKLPNNFFIENDMLYLSKRIDNDIYDIVSFVIKGLLHSLVNIFFLISTIILLWKIGFLWTAIFFIIALLYIIVYKLLQKTMFALLFDVREKQNKYFARFTDNFIYIHAIKIHSLSKEFMGRFQNTFKDWLVAGLKEAKFSLWFSSSRDMINKVIVVLIFFFGGSQVLNSNLSVGNFVALSGYYALAFSGLAYFLNLGHEYQDALSAYARLKEIQNYPIEKNGYCYFDNGISIISLENVTYSLNDNIICDNFSYTFTAGNIYCLTGKNGSGKSTFLKLLMGIVKPQSGYIKYNSISIDDVDLITERRKNISVVEQFPFIVDDSLENNIKFGVDATDKNLYDNLLDKFKLGIIEYRKFENSVSLSDKLSGGEKQKIALLRGMLKKASVFLLDEPESSLDINAMEILLKLLREEKETRITIIVSHEPKVIELADYIVQF